MNQYTSNYLRSSGMTRMLGNFISITFLAYILAPTFNKRCTLTSSFPMHSFSKMKKSYTANTIGGNVSFTKKVSGI